MRTYGDLQWLAPGQFGPRPVFAFKVEPHVAIRLKRVFPRIAPWQGGWLTVSDTPEVARDLEWCLERWPLRGKGEALAKLAARADQHRVEQEAVQRILGGGQGRFDEMLRQPIRDPRGYQREAADVVLSGGGRVLIGDDVGLGKTFTAMLVLLDPEALPAVFVTLTHLPRQMQDELAKSLPWLRSHVVRRAQWYDPRKLRGSDGHAPDVLFLSYSKLAGWGDHLAGQARTVIFDEAQELRTGPGSLKYDAARQLAADARYVIGLTATPVYNYGDEAHSVLQVIAPDVLGSRDEFIREWGTGSGGKVLVKDPTALGHYLRDQGVLVARSRADVGRELPPALVITEPVDADAAELEKVAGDAAALARLILSRDSSRQQRFEASGELDWKLRQATGLAKAPYVAAFVRMILESERRVVLFGWHRDVYALWLEMLADLNPRLYTGSESPNQKRQAVADFLDGDCRVLIMSLRAGAGVDGLQKGAKVAVFGELDWSPGIHHQCIGRLRRDGDVDPAEAETVVAYMLLSEEGTDPAMAEVLQIKRGQSEPLMNPNARPFATSAVNVDRVRLLAASVLERHGQALPEAAADLPRQVEGQAELDLDTGTG